MKLGVVCGIASNVVTPRSHALVSQKSFMKYYFFALIAVSCYSFIGPMSKKMRLANSPYLFLSVYSGLTCICSIIMGMNSKEPLSFLSLNHLQLLGIIIIAFANMIGWVLYLKALGSMPVAHYDMIAGAGIVLTALFSSLLLGEPLHMRYIPAILLIISGIWVAVRS